MEIPSVHLPDVANLSRAPVSPPRSTAPVASSGSPDLDTEGDRPRDLPRDSSWHDRRKGADDPVPRLEDASIRALAELRRARHPAQMIPLPLPLLELARRDLLASVAEIRQAMIPPPLTHLNRRR